MMTLHDTAHCCPPSQHRPGLLAVFGRLHRLFTARRERARLSGLDPHLLNDIGLSAEMAEAEAARAIWDVPTHWKR